MGKLSYARTLLRDLLRFSKQNKAYWIVPVIVVFGLLAIFIVISQTVAPFIYSLF